MNEQTISQTEQAGIRLATTTNEVSVVKLYAVATAFHEGVMTYDPNAQGGKGRFKGGSDVVRIMADGAASASCEVPVDWTPQYVAKVARVLVDLGRHLLDLATPEVREQGCRDWVAQYGDPLSVYNAMMKARTEPKGATLAQMVANLLSWASKNDVPVADVLAEVVAQAEGDAEGEAE